MSLQHSTTSPSLIDRVKANDADAWRRFVDLYGPLVFHWAKRLGLDDHASSDVLQEVFAAVAKAVGGFSQGGNGSSFRGWLWTITRNKVRDHHRAGANRNWPRVEPTRSDDWRLCPTASAMTRIRIRLRDSSQVFITVRWNW